MVGGITFSGLMSGLSTDDIVEALVGLRRTPITQIENLAEGRGFEKSAYQLVNSGILSLQGALLNLRLESSYLSKLASSSAPGLLGVSARFNAVPASYSMSIQSVAQGARAVSGLNDRSLKRAAARMAVGNSAGITQLSMTANQLGGTRARSSTLLVETLQAGTGSAAVTLGDRIKIDVTLKDTSSNTVYFDFTGDATDTMARLGQSIVEAFQGEAQVSVDANGAFRITETVPSGAATISLDGLTFVDADYSGSTFTINTGNTMAGNFATARTIVGTRTFTTGSSANIATGVELLTALDQWDGGVFSGDETIEISGMQYDGDAVSSSFAVGAATTLNDIITELQTQFNEGANPPWETTVTIENGKIVLRDQSTGSSSTSISMYFYDPDGNLNLNTGTFITVEQGSSDVTQTILTTGFAEAAEGRHLVTATEGKAGVVTGTVSLDGDTILGSLGVTETNIFTIDRDDGAGAVDPVTVFGVTTRSTVQDLIDAINGQIHGVTAQLVDDGGGSYNLQILASEGGVDIRLTDETTGVGILENVLNPDVGFVDSDISTLADAGLPSVESATTVDSDYTFTTIYKPGNGGPVQRRTVTDSDGTAITDLISNVQLLGAGNAFNDGVAVINTAQNSELNVAPAMQQIIIGTSDVAEATSTSTPPLNIYTTIDNSGLDILLTAGTFTINGVQITIDGTDTQTLDEVMGLVNSSGAGVLMEYDSVHDRFLIYRPNAGNTNPITLGGVGDTSNIFTALGLLGISGAVQFSGSTEGTINTGSALAYSGLSIPAVSGTFTINGVKITVNVGADSFEDIIKRINDSPAGVIASYDSNLDRLVLTQDLSEPPLFDSIQIGSGTDTSNFWSAMRYTDSYQTSQLIGSSREKAQFTIDGETYIRDTNTVDDAINDVTLSIKGVSSDPIAVDITSDTSRATKFIRDFVVAYNELLEFVNVAPLTDEDQDYLAPLTDNRRTSLTFSEIDEYEATREELWVREYLYRSGTLNRLDNSIRLNTFSPVASITDSAFRMLSDIGITTGDVGFGLDYATSAFLVTDSTDPDVILQKLEENRVLQNALESDAEDVLALFGNPVVSTVEVIGVVDITYGITLAAPLSFSIGNGTTQATVTFGIGFTSGSQIMSEIVNSLAQVGLGEQYRVYQTDAGFIQIISETDTERARISIQDLGAGSNLANVLGIAPQTVIGDDPIANAGLARRLDAFLDGYVGTNGIISEKIKLGGLIDRELVRLADRIDDYEYRLILYGLRLQRQFTQMEITMSLYQQTSLFLEAQLGVTSLLGSSSSSGGIPLSM